jgi:hypothetical protein
MPAHLFCTINSKLETFTTPVVSLLSGAIANCSHLYVNQNRLVPVLHAATTTRAKAAAWLQSFSLGYHSMVQTPNASRGMGQLFLRNAKQALSLLPQSPAKTTQSLPAAR